MNQNVFYANQPELQLHFCFKCRWEGRTAQNACPQCGSSLFSQTNVRVRGVLLTILGLFLSGLMSAVAFFVTVSLAGAANNPNSGAKFNGDAGLLLVVYLIFGGVIAMGVTITVAGLWQLVFGRRNMFLIWIFFGLIILTLFIGGIFRVLAG